MPAVLPAIPLDRNGLPPRHGVAIYAIAHELVQFFRELPDWPCDMGEADLELCAERCATAYLHTVKQVP